MDQIAGEHRSVEPLPAPNREMVGRVARVGFNRIWSLSA